MSDTRTWTMAEIEAEKIRQLSRPKTLAVPDRIDYTDGAITAWFRGVRVGVYPAGIEDSDQPVAFMLVPDDADERAHDRAVEWLWDRGYVPEDDTITDGTRGAHETFACHLRS